MCSAADGCERNDVFEQLKGCGIALDFCFRASAAGLHDVRVDGEGALTGNVVRQSIA
jgi:hypothetical protein